MPLAEKEEAREDMAAAPKSVPERRAMDYHTTVWGDFFLTHVPQTDEVVKGWEEAIEVLKSNVKRRLSAPINDNDDDLGKRLNLVDVIERLGLGYHFEEEIDHFMRQVYQNNINDHIDDLIDLNTIALRLRLLRQHGYHASSDVFNKFKTEGGAFKEELANDIEGMLNLYEAGYLRIKGEPILDEVVEFTKTRLTAIATKLDSPRDVDRINRALKRPLRKVIEKYEHLFFISFYETLESHDPAILKLAKLNFNVLQNLYQTELRALTEWWLKLDTPRKLPYARDRLVESYLWALGGVWEPKYSIARQLAAKATQFGTLLDDTYDNQGTIQELELFTSAIARWDTSSKKDLKHYMIVLFDGITGIFDQIVSNTSKERGLWYLDYGKSAIGNAVRWYLEEEKRTDKDYVATVEEYRQVSSFTTCYQWITYCTLSGMGDSVSKDAFQWLLSQPTMLIAATDQCRLQDDIADCMVHYSDNPSDHSLSMALLKEDEKEQKASLLECYMKQYGASKQEAIDAVDNFVEEDWMVMNEELLKPPRDVPIKLLLVLLRFAKNMDTLYIRTMMDMLTRVVLLRI